MTSKLKLLAVALATTFATQASATEFHVEMQSFITENVSAWASDPILTDAIRAQNTQTSDFDQAKIDELDLLWRSLVGADDTVAPIRDVLTGPAADFLREQVAATNGAITEAFIMDARGLNVAASAATSDYWQGDEDKFTQTYPLGANAIHFGDIEVDESTETVQGQVSMTIVDTTTGDVIGAMTIGIDLTALM